MTLILIGTSTVSCTVEPTIRSQGAGAGGKKEDFRDDSGDSSLEEERCSNGMPRQWWRTS